jgi:ABC-type glycerol-3-phosphate transport system substrate-binding protein
MIFRRLGLLGCLGILACGLLAIPGCDDEPEKAKSPVHSLAGQTVTIAFPAGYGFGDPWRVALNEWSEQTGAKCTLAEYTRSPAGMKELPAGDVLVLAYADLPGIDPREHLARIPEGTQIGEISNGWIDFFPGLRERVLTIAGRPTLVPISCPTLACYLRGDLLAKAALKPPETWDEYQTLLDSLPKWAPGLTAVEPWAPEFRAPMFLARALSDVKKSGDYSVFFDIDTGAPLIDSPGFARALTRTMTQFAKLSPDSGHLSPDDCRRLILTGKAAMALSFEPGRPDEKPIERAAGISLTFVRLPGAREVYDRHGETWGAPPDSKINYATLAPVGGLTLAVAKATPPERAEAAWSLVNFLSTEQFQAALANVPKSVCRETQLAKAVDWVGPELRTDEVYGYLAVTAESLRTKNISPDLPVIGRAAFEKALTEGINAALEKKATPEAALKQVGDRWRALASGFGVERVRDSYRSCLGLAPALKLKE